MNKMSAIIFILNRLDCGNVTIRGLAEELNVSTKSIQRYIREIETAEFPLYNPAKGTYTFVDGFSLQKMHLSDTEAGLLVFFNSLIDSLNNKKLNKSFDSLKNKILQYNADNPFYVKMEKGPKYEVNDITKTIEKAVKEKKYVVIKSVYNKTIEKLKPIKIAYYDGFWYLICSIGRKNKILKYNISTIKEIEITDEEFEITKDINKILKDSINIYFESKRDIKIKLSVAQKVSKYFKVKKYFPLQQITKENKDGSLILECTIAKKEEILPTIFHWLPNIKVLEPQWLDEKVKEIIGQY